MNKKNMPEIRFSGFDDEWTQIFVKDIFHITRGYVLSTKKISDTKRGKYIYPVFSSQTMDNGLLGYYKDYLYDNSITWTTDGANAGSVNFRSGKFYCTNVCGVLLSETGNANSMVANAINNVAHNFVSRVGNPKLMNNIMAEISFRKPSLLYEELKISEFLNKIEDLINKTEKQYNYFKNVKETLLNKMFPNGYSDFPEIRFDGFEEKWNNSELNKLIDYSGSGGTPISTNEDYYGGKIPFLSINDITLSGNYIYKTKKSITDLGLKNSSAWLVPKESISLAMYASVGKVAILKTDLATSQAFFNMVINDLSLRDVIFQYLKLLEYNDGWLQLISTGTQQNLNAEKIKKIKIKLPSSGLEQTKIGKLFKNLDDLIALIKQKHEKLKNIKNALLDKMFC